MNSDPYFEKQDLNCFPVWRDESHPIYQLDLELTERCNNNCLHCCINLPAYDTGTLKRELKTDEWKEILRQAADLGVITVRFTGGEPLLREDFEELYVYARRLGMGVLIFTNARLLTPKIADLFVRIAPREKIEITVYGMTPETYEAVTRVRGSFPEFWKGVNLLIERKVPFIVKGAIMPHNKQDLKTLEEWAKNIPWMNEPPSYAMFFDLRSRRDQKKKNEMINSLRVSPEEGLAILARNPIQFRRELVQFCTKFMGAQANRLFSCGVGHGACIDAYGLAQPCLSLRVPELCYDLKKGSLREALTVVFPKIREMKSQNPDYLKKCALCFIKGLCEQCPAKSYAEHGNLDTRVEYFCKVAHAQARFLGLIDEKENAWEVNDASERIKKLRDTSP